MLIKRTKKEMNAYLDEMYDRVWFVRAHATNDETLKAEIRIKKLQELDRIQEELGLVYQNTEVSDWEYGYWSGILAGLRWALGDEKDMLDT